MDNWRIAILSSCPTAVASWFFAQGTAETQGIYLGSLDSAATTLLTISQTAATYLQPGWVLWVRDGSLVARRLDLENRSLTGNVVQLADAVGFDGLGRIAVSTSASGMVAYRSGAQNRNQLRWIDRAGKALGVMGPPDTVGMNNPRLSPDAKQVAVIRAVQGNADVWLLDSNRSTRFTFDLATDWFAEWSPDGRQLVFDSNRRGATRDLYIKPTDRASSEQLLLEAEAGALAVAIDWSPDGRFLLYVIIKPPDFDIWVLPLTGTRKPFPFLSTQFVEKGAQFSPDGRWVAYMSNESGRMEIYLRPFVEPGERRADESLGGQWQVSIDGGIYPAWRPDGRELYYLGPDGTMMGVPVSTASSKVEVGTPVALFETQIYGGGMDGQQNRQYDIAPDGRFLVNTLLDDATPITLLQNWKAQ